MHRNPDAAVSHGRNTLTNALLRGLVGVGCLLAGAVLVSVATPRHRLAAEATQQTGDAVLLDFTASWCGPCREMSPIVDRLAQQGYPVRKVDVDQQRAIAERFRVTSLPTFILVVQGKEVMRQTGATSEAQLRRMLLQIPAWQQELAAQAARSQPPQRLAQTEPRNAPSSNDFAASPFSIDLGTPQAGAPSTPAGSSTAAASSNPSSSDAEPSRRGFGLPFLARNRQEPAAPRDTGSAVVRGQNHEAAPPVTAGTQGPASDPMQASTRLRVKDSSGVNFGSGTILESRIGRTVILTCGHIFRHLGENGLVEVDVFVRGQQPITYVGKVIRFDADSDVGLVAIPTTERLPFIPLASIDAPLQIGDALLSIGCGGGELPSRETIEVTALNKYNGPDNIECTGCPIQGRSGGGLFRGKELVGVCILADPKDRRGVYTGLAPIYELLETSGFGHLLPVGRPAVVQGQEQAFATVVGERQPGSRNTDATSFDRDSGRDVDLGAVFGQAAEAFAETAPQGTAGLSDLQQVLGQAPDSEVICIVRPKNSQIPSRVVIIHEASPKLVGYLLDSMGDSPLRSGSPPEMLSRSNAPSLIPTTATADLRGPAFPAIETLPIRNPAPATRPVRPASPR